jgi:hypothetical protein
MDIFQIEARGMYSPPNGNFPQSLPDLWRPTLDEEIRTDLPELTDEQLNALGWKGPIQMPPTPGTSYYTHDYEWNTETRKFDAIEIDQSEKRNRVNYQVFWDSLLNTSAYGTIKATASQSLAVNTIATEFIALLSDAKNKYPNVEKIQEALTVIIENIPFTEEELSEIQEIFIKSGMFAVYTLQ